jgi:hypothetical protein
LYTLSENLTTKHQVTLFDRNPPFCGLACLHSQQSRKARPNCVRATVQPILCVVWSVPGGTTPGGTIDLVPTRSLLNERGLSLSQRFPGTQLAINAFMLGQLKNLSPTTQLTYHQDKAVRPQHQPVSILPFNCNLVQYVHGFLAALGIGI